MKFWETLYDASDGTFIGKSGKELGISELDDPYMYQKIGTDKYRVLAGPKASAIGNEFVAKQKSEKGKPSEKSGKKPSASKSNQKFTYTIGNTATVNGINGVKFLKRKEGDKKIVKTFLIPDDLDAENILSRVPPNEFKKEENQKELSDAGYAYEKETGKEIKGLEPVLPEKGKKLPPGEFFGTFGPIVKKAARGTPVFPSVTLAQAAIETGWGSSTVGDAKNMFGIKAKGKTNQYWTGDSVKKNTTEYIKGKKGTYKLAFRKYNSLTDSILDHNEFLKVNPRYSKALDATSPEMQAKLIHKAGYATDPNYSKKIISMIKKYDLKQYDDDVLAAKGVEAGDARIAENKKRRKSMIINEAKLRRLIRATLLVENVNQIKNIQSTIGTNADGKWGKNTDAAWVKWVEDHVDNIVSLSGEAALTKDDVLKIKSDAAGVASLIFKDPKKKNITGVNELIEKYNEKFPGEADKEKAQAAKDKAAEEARLKKFKGSTDGKYEFAKGQGAGGTYPAAFGMKNAYFKFYKDGQAFALDSVTGELKQRPRGKSGEGGKPLDFTLKENKNAIYSKHRLIRRLLENYVNPAKVFMDLKKPENVKDTTGVFADNKDKIEKIADEQIKILRTPYSEVNHPQKVNKIVINGQTVFHVNGRFDQMSSKCKATIAHIWKIAEEEGIELPPVVTSGPRNAYQQSRAMAIAYHQKALGDNPKAAGRAKLLAMYTDDNKAGKVADFFDTVFTPGISEREFKNAVTKTGVVDYLSKNKISNHQYGNAFDIRTNYGHEENVRKLIAHPKIKDLIIAVDETDRGDQAHFHISVKKAPPKPQVAEGKRKRRRINRRLR